MNTIFEAVDFSVAMTNQLFTYDSKTGVIRLKATGCKIGNLNTAEGGTRIECNGKTVSGARVAWIIETGNTIPPGYAVVCRQRTPGHYGNRMSNLYLVDIARDPNFYA